MNEIITYVLLVVVVWRLTHLITEEDGPFDLVIKLRKLVGNSFFGKLMDCFYCSSIWIGFGVAIYVTRDIELCVILTLYYSGAAIVLEKLTIKNS